MSANRSTTETGLGFVSRWVSPPAAWAAWLAGQVDGIPDARPSRRRQRKSVEAQIRRLRGAGGGLDPELLKPPPHPLQDYPRFPNVGGRVRADGPFRNLGRMAFGKAAGLSPYLQVNPGNCFAVLLFDVDDWERAELSIGMGRVPVPTWKVLDKQTGRGHMAYVLAVPVHDNRLSSLAAVEYLASIEGSLQPLLGADLAFAQRATTRNPWLLSLFCDTTWFDRTYPLTGLVPQGGLLAPPPAGAREQGLGRHVSLFRGLLAEAEPLRWSFYGQGREVPDLFPGLVGIAEEINGGFGAPLPGCDVLATARVVHRYSKRWTHSKRLKGRKSGRAGGIRRRAATADRDYEVWKLAEWGWTQRRIAADPGIRLSQQGVGKVLARFTEADARRLEIAAEAEAGAAYRAQIEAERWA